MFFMFDFYGDINNNQEKQDATNTKDEQLKLKPEVLRSTKRYIQYIPSLSIPPSLLRLPTIHVHSDSHAANSQILSMY